MGNKITNVKMVISPVVVPFLSRISHVRKFGWEWRESSTCHWEAGDLLSLQQWLPYFLAPTTPIPTWYTVHTLLLISKIAWGLMQSSHHWLWHLWSRQFRCTDSNYVVVIMLIQRLVLYTYQDTLLPIASWCAHLLNSTLLPAFALCSTLIILNIYCKLI